MVALEATVYLPFDVEFSTSKGRKQLSPGSGNEAGPSIRGPGPGQCAAGVHAGAGVGAGAGAGSRAGTVRTVGVLLFVFLKVKA